MERGEFVFRVRRAVAASRLPSAPAQDPGLLAPDSGIADPVGEFARSVLRVDGMVHTGDPGEAMRAVIQRHGPGPWLSWDAEQLPVPGLVDVLAEAGPRLDHRVAADRRRDHQAGYRDVRYGLTGAEAAFAQSGTIVVRSGPGRPRMASVVPPVHVAVLRRDRIVGSLAEWAEVEAEGMAADSNVVFITGPSRTADIEQRLTLGVHGPRHLHVILAGG